MTRILILTAVELEARGLARHLGLSAVPGGEVPRFTGGVLEIACVGLRASRLHAGLTSTAPALVISAGACGALAPDLPAGALVVPEAVVTPDGRSRATAAVIGLPRRGTLLTVDEVVVDAAAKARWWMQTGALAVDMESRPILDWAAARGVPAAVVRAVSDPAGRGVPADLADVVADDGRLRRMRAVTAVLARPRAVADAMALRAGTTAALRAVARALGDLARAR